MPQWRWEVGYGLGALERISEDWDALAHGGSVSPTADALWMRCFWGAFGGADGQLALHCLYEGAKLLAVVPLQHRGSLVRTWASVMNTQHTPYWTFAIAEDRGEVGCAILDHLLESTEMIDLKPLRSTGPIRKALIEAGRSRKVVCCQNQFGGDAVIELVGPWESFLRSLPKKVIANTTRRLRNLEKAGKVEFQIVEGGDELTSLLDECFALEALGWKGEYGSPIAVKPSTRRFYTELAKGASAAGRLAIYTLRLDGKLIAFDYCLRAQGKINSLKESYDPKWSNCSPSNVLRYMLLKGEIEKGEISSFHLGWPAEWKLRWATRVEPLVRLRIYRRGPRAMGAYYCGPRLRATLKKSSVARRAVACARALGSKTVSLMRRREGKAVRS